MEHRGSERDMAAVALLFRPSRLVEEASYRDEGLREGATVDGGS